MVPDPADIEVANLAAQLEQPEPANSHDLSFLSADETPVAAPAEAVKPTEPAVEPAKPTEPVTPVAPLAVQPQPAPLPHHQHPRQLVAAAIAIGLDLETIKGVETDLLADVVNQAYRNAQQTQPAPKQEAPRFDPKASLEKIEKEIGAAPEVVALMRWQAEQIEELKSRPDPAQVVHQAIRARDQSSSGEKAIDHAINALGTKFEKVLGKGALSEMESGPQKAARVRLFQSAGIDFSKDSPAQIRQKITAAANDTYGAILTDAPSPAGEYGKPVEPAKAPPKAKEPEEEKKYTKAEWLQMGLGRPTGGKAPTNREKQLAQVTREFFREHDLNGRDEPHDEFEGVPE